MGSEQTYQWLMDSSAPGIDRFDAHVAASILALAMDEGGALGERVGLAGPALRGMVGTLFPGALDVIAATVPDEALSVEAEEDSVRTVLWQSAAAATGFERDLAAMIARRCLCPHHLWQDLGLRHRGELSQLMRTHFPLLAHRNNRDMKWKKFLYRTVCASEGFSLCAAPVCSECDDFVTCFGAEDGEALVSRMRRDVVAVV